MIIDNLAQATEAELRDALEAAISETFKLAGEGDEEGATEAMRESLAINDELRFRGLDLPPACRL
jgi:hypothetical protein